MTKKAALSIRISTQLKKAIERAAADDGRSVASLVQKVLSDYLKAKGYLGK